MRHAQLWKVEALRIEALNGAIKLDIEVAEGGGRKRWAIRMLTKKEAHVLQAQLAAALNELELTNG